MPLDALLRAYVYFVVPAKDPEPAGQPADEPLSPAKHLDLDPDLETGLSNGLAAFQIGCLTALGIAMAVLAVMTGWSFRTGKPFQVLGHVGFIALALLMLLFGVSGLRYTLKV